MEPRFEYSTWSRAQQPGPGQNLIKTSSPGKKEVTCTSHASVPGTLLGWLAWDSPAHKKGKLHFQPFSEPVEDLLVAWK